LIVAGSYNFYEIAAMVGFNDAHYFSTRFVEIVGSTPSEYKQRADYKLCCHPPITFR
jgi:AraC-like DNA-binding protein